MSLPKVSIIIPYYNRPLKLERCLQSVYAQTFSDYEIIVVDDASGIAPLSLREDVIIIRQVQNQGPGMARNEGLKKAKGNYVAFLDSDDYWHPEFLERLHVQLVSHPHAVMAYALTNKVQDGTIVGNKRRHDSLFESILPNILFRGKPWATSACLWRADSIEGIAFVPYRNWEDYVFDIEVGLKFNELCFVKDFLVFYDESGEDKLSRMDYSFQFTEKNKSLCYVSHLLSKSSYSGDADVNKYITILLLLNLVKLKKHYIKQRKYYRHILKALWNWRSPLFVLQVWFFTLFGKRLGMRFLKKFKNRVEDDNLPYLLK